MGLKTHAGQANPNPNIKAQANTLSAKPLSPFKPEGTVKQTQTVGLSEAKQSQTKELPNLNPSRRQFIEQYGAYALVTPVALYAMMSPNRAMAQAGSVGVGDTRPRVLYNREIIPTFDATTRTEGYVDSDGDLTLQRGEKYTTPQGVSYTCSLAVCYISPIADGGGGRATYSSQFDISYPDDVVQATDDVVVDDSPRLLVKGERIEAFDLDTATTGIVHTSSDGRFLIFSEGRKYTAPDGVVYTCAARYCNISSTGENVLGIFSYRPR